MSLQEQAEHIFHTHTIYNIKYMFIENNFQEIFYYQE